MQAWYRGCFSFLPSPHIVRTSALRLHHETVGEGGNESCGVIWGACSTAVTSRGQEEQGVREKSQFYAEKLPPIRQFVACHFLFLLRSKGSPGHQVNLLPWHRMLAFTPSPPPRRPVSFLHVPGPAKTPEGLASGSFGPTTAGRMDGYVDSFMRNGGSFVTLAKGNR